MFHVKQIFSYLIILISLGGYGQKMLMFEEATIPTPKTIYKAVGVWNKSQPEYLHLSLKEQQFYYWVNYSRVNPARFFDSVVVPITDVYPQLKGNNFRSLEQDLKTAPALPMLSLSSTLNEMAAAHSLDITSHDASPSHNSSNGESFADRYKRYQLKNCGGENISYGAQNADPIFMLVLLYLDINVSDLGHRKALLNPSYINTGISAACSQK